MLLAVTLPHARGRKGKIHPNNRKDFANREYTSENGAKNIASTSGTCVLTWLSGCGTTLGAGSILTLLPLLVDDRGEAKPFSSVSCRRTSWGGGSWAAAAATGSSVGSPSKKRVTAILTFHCARWSIGIASDVAWSVTAVYC